MKAVPYLRSIEGGRVNVKRRELPLPKTELPPLKIGLGPAGWCAIGFICGIGWAFVFMAAVR